MGKQSEYEKYKDYFRVIDKFHLIKMYKNGMTRKIEDDNFTTACPSLPPPIHFAL